MQLLTPASPAPDRAQGRRRLGRPRSDALLLLLVLLLPANCMLLAQGLMAWRRGPSCAAAHAGGCGSRREARLRLQRLEDSSQLPFEDLNDGEERGKQSGGKGKAQRSSTSTASDSGGAVNRALASGTFSSSSGGGDGIAKGEQVSGAFGEHAGAAREGGASKHRDGAAAAAGDSGCGSSASSSSGSGSSSMGGSSSGSGSNGLTPANATDGSVDGSSDRTTGPDMEPNPEWTTLDPPRRALLPLPEVEGSSNDTCAQALRMPKVALLFLTQGDLFHHRAWYRWFAAAEGLLPAAKFRAAACERRAKRVGGASTGQAAAQAAVVARRQLRKEGPPPRTEAEGPSPAGAEGSSSSSDSGSGSSMDPVERAQQAIEKALKERWAAMKTRVVEKWMHTTELTKAAELAAACGWNATSGQPLALPPDGREAGKGSSSAGAGGPIDRQHLFSVYVHAPPNVTDANLHQLFRGRLITSRIHTKWGSHQLVEATRNLLWEAFRDPLNERFVLLSESDIPLYDPLTLYQQLLAEGKSRVNLCRRAERPIHTERWSWRMGMPSLRHWHWRKSSQWFGLMRRHVEVVLNDVEVFRRFEAFCKYGYDPDYSTVRDCFSDEHYIPTLLASKELDDECSCHIDGMVAVDWSDNGAHPKAYKFWEVSPRLIRELRLKQDEAGCNFTAAIADAQRLFISKQEVFGAARGAAEGAEGGRDGTSAEPGEALHLAWQREQCAPGRSWPAYAHPLLQKCPLTARKFPRSTTTAVLSLFRNCSNKLHLPLACRRPP